MFSWFDLAWPWFGLAAAGILAVLLATPLLRSDTTVARRFDPRWVGFLGMAVYLVHQAEEYGLAANGVPHAFPDSLCTLLGQGAYPGCTIPPIFYLAVNLPLIWVAAPLAAILAPRVPGLALGVWGVIAVNAVVHIAPAIIQWRYDPGLLTALVLFVPISVVVLSSMTSPRGPLPRRAIAPVLGAGVAMHAVLMGGILAFLHLGLPAWALVALQPLGVLVGYAIVTAGSRPRRVPPRAPGSAPSRG